MAPIFSLPVDLFFMIRDQIDEEDLLSLRQTCRALNDKLWNLQLDEVYHTQHIFLVPVFLENLLKLPGTPKAPNRRARHLKVHLKVPYVTRLPPEDGEDARIAALQTEAYNHTIAIEKMCRSKEQLPLLKQVLSTFPNTNTITFELAPPSRLSHFALDTLYPSLGLARGEKLSEKLRRHAMEYLALYEGYNYNQMWLDVLDSAVAAGLQNIHTLGFTNPYGKAGIHIPRFQLSPEPLLRLKSGFPNLRQLELFLSLEDCTAESCAGFTQWLESIGAQLEELKVLNTGRMFWPVENRRLLLPTSSGLPKLRVLEINSMTLDVDNLIGFLSHSKTRLTALQLEGCWFRHVPFISPTFDPFGALSSGNGSEVDCFTLLNYAYTELEKLQKLDLAVLFTPTCVMRLQVKGQWGSGELCHAELTQSEVPRVLIMKDFKSKLFMHPNANSFWNSATALIWSGPNVKQDGSSVRITHYRTDIFDTDDSEDESDEEDDYYSDALATGGIIARAVRG